MPPLPRAAVERSLSRFYLGPMPDSTSPRARLLAELERVRRSVAATEETGLSVLLDACRTGGPPPVGSLEDQRMLAGLRDREARRVAALVDALRRLDRGEYGRCASCGGVIEAGRLEALPEAERCAACAT